MADIASALRTWSATAASNSPSGATNVGTGMDDNLREIQAVLRKYLASPASNMASAATVNLATADGFHIHITGTTQITALGTESAGIYYLLEFDGALTFTYNATSLILPGSASITTAAGDCALMISLGSGNWKCIYYTKRSGAPIVNANLTGHVTSTGNAAVLGSFTLAQLNTAVSDADIARTDAANTFTGIQTFSTPIATGSVATMTATVGGGVPTPPNNTTTFLRGDGTFNAPPSTGLTLSAEQATTSGTTIDFTSIPAGTKLIHVMFRGVSTSGTSVPLLQLGDSGGIENTAYVAYSGGTSYTTGFGLAGAWDAARVIEGMLTLVLQDSSDNTWCLGGSVGVLAAATATAGTKSLSATLDRIRLTTVGGTDTFDAGAVSISYL